MHLAVIPDGNRRWAKEKGLSKKEGHSKGVKKIFMTIDWFLKKDELKELSIFLLSTENFKKRDKDEINYLEHLGMQMLNVLQEKYKGKLKINVAGKIEDLKEELSWKIKEVEVSLQQGKQFNILLNYGGRLEIVNAAKNIPLQENIDEIDEDKFKKYLWVKSDVDLVIRTGKETRISNFLLYQIAYAEIFFLDIYWPDITADILENVLNKFKKKNRRFGR